MVNNPRLLHPCLDVPLASVQIDDSGSVDLLNPDRQRKFSFSLRKRNSLGIFNTPFGNQNQSSYNGFSSPSLWNKVHINLLKIFYLFLTLLSNDH